MFQYQMFPNLPLMTRVTCQCQESGYLTAVVQLIPPGKHPALCREEVQLQPVLPVADAGGESPSTMSFLLVLLFSEI